MYKGQVWVEIRYKRKGESSRWIKILVYNGEDEGHVNRWGYEAAGKGYVNV